MNEPTANDVQPTPTPGSDPTPTPPAPVVPEGYVPAAEVETAREEARRRYQSELDKARAENERLKAAQPAAPKDGNSGGFDPDSFRQSLLRDVSSVLTLNQTVDQVKAEFPHADPALFSPEKLSQFGSPESLRLAAEDSHRRVTEILAREREAIEARLREELAAASAGGQTPVGGPAPAPGDPTPEQLANMSFAEFAALPDEVLERVGAV